ncbi:hypothetical protein [Kitasatospora griseola]|uniref:hypothetical protein n=1 Tax=Kitasatospora griseola TaxID=2064 RepID=UPI003800D0DA
MRAPPTRRADRAVAVRGRLTAQLAELNARIGELSTARDALADLTTCVREAA